MKQGLSDVGVRRLRRLNALLAEGLALSEADRAAWLARIEATDPENIERLRALLVRSQVETDDFLREGVEGVLPLDADAAGDQPGDEVGPYRLLSRLGQGGMAAVWLAERRDEQLHRQVALKLPINAWGAGPGLARRMARERNILAAMEHPRIARLYEAGVTAAGRPWLAMERVVGQPLDEWCREHDPEVPELLRLFLQIADAVSHAHAHLIVHRDLKPANVLVDAKGDVHLLDFGVAKLLDDPADEVDPQLTRQIGRAVTPDYAAPEQMGQRPLTMACDVYALGIMLYEMLAGERPYRLKFESYGELEARALAVPVPLASSTAKRDDPDRARDLRGDLDTILLKALQKDPRDRYASVQSMADDIRRHLDGQPVLARTPSLAYVAAKLLRRHRAAVLVATSIFLALGGGLAVAVWQWHEANRERENTERLLTRSLAVQQFAARVLTETIDRNERVSLDELLGRTTSFLDGNGNGNGDALEHAAGATTLAGWYNSYGNYKEADAVLSKAIAQLDAKREPELMQMMRCQQGHAWSGLGRFADAEKRLLEVAQDPSTEAASASFCYRILAIRKRNDNKPKEALAYANLALERLNAAPGARPLERALILGEQAYVEGLLGRPDAADALFSQTLEQFDKLGRGESVSAVSLYNNWAIAWLNAGRPRQAWPHLERAAAIARRRSPTAELPSYLIYNRANALRAMGRGDAALQELSPLQGAIQKGNAPPAEAMGLWLSRFFAQAMQGQTAEALQSFDEMARIAGAVKFNVTSSMGAAWAYVQAKRFLMLDQPAQAQAVMAAWLDAMQRAGLSNGTVVRALLTHAEALSRQGLYDEALRDLEKAQAAAAGANSAPGALTLLSGQVWLELGKTHARAHQPERAREAFAQSLRHLQDSVGPEHPQTVEAAKALAEFR